MRDDPPKPTTPDTCCCAPAASSTPAPSRRALLTASAGLAAGAAVAPFLAGSARAQGAGAADADGLLARVQGQRRIVLRGGVVLTLDRGIGDFAQADVLIENGKIREVRPNIAISSDDAAVIDATNRIVVPGFVDTHHHFYQGLLRSILTNGLLNPDYTRDIGNTLTPAYAPADAYAGVLITALGMIDMGTTTAVDTSQVSHTPEHSDACIRALQESGIRAVYAYWRGSGPGMRYPEDIVRLQRSYFNSQDQLLTLALGALLDAKIFAYAREVGVRCVSHGVSNNTERTLLELGSAGLLRPGDEYIHCTHLSDTAWRLLKDTGARISVAAPIEMAMGHGLP
ncbi:MAG: amidohydrolase family protein, partial [Xanthobacteraceae bacterium]